MIVTSDYWENVINDERTDRFPNWENIERAINRLDEKTYTLVVLEDEKGLNLFIGGGQSGVVVALSSEEDHLIARQGDETTPTSVTVGGQAGDYRKRNIISAEQARGIAKAFFQGVNVWPLAQWDND